MEQFRVYCQTCGRLFTGTHKIGKSPPRWCSATCQESRYHAPAGTGSLLRHRCQQCGTEFGRPVGPSAKGKQPKYCSTICYNEATRQRNYEERKARAETGDPWPYLFWRCGLCGQLFNHVWRGGPIPECCERRAGCYAMLSNAHTQYPHYWERIASIPLRMRPPKRNYKAPDPPPERQIERCPTCDKEYPAVIIRGRRSPRACSPPCIRADLRKFYRTKPD